MTLKIVPFKKTILKDEFSTNRHKSFMFAHCGADYWRACEAITKINKDSPELTTIWVKLPLMHMALELLVKAIITFDNEKFDPKGKKHHTLNLINEYAAQIDVFNKINNDLLKKKLISELENSWELVRYGECSFSYDYKDMDLFDEMMSELYDKYSNLSGLEHL
jgi:hypothetical protein